MVLAEGREGFDRTEMETVSAVTRQVAEKVLGAPPATADDWTRVHAETTDDEILTAFDETVAVPEPEPQRAAGGAGEPETPRSGATGEPAPDLFDAPPGLAEVIAAEHQFPLDVVKGAIASMPEGLKDNKAAIVGAIRAAREKDKKDKKGKK